MGQPNCCGGPRFVHSSASLLSWGSVSSSADTPACKASRQIAAPALAANSSIHRVSLQIYAGAMLPRLRPQENTVPHISTVATHSGSMSKSFSLVSILVFMEHFLPTCHQTHVRVSCDEPPPPLNLLQIPLSYTQFGSL